MNPVRNPTVHSHTDAPPRAFGSLPGDAAKLSMADALDPDPHGTRGSTVHHALDYKKEVKKFSSADILASFHAAQRGEVVPVKALDGGAASASSSSSSSASGPPPTTAAPRPPTTATSRFSSEEEKRKLAEGAAQGAAGAAAGAQAVEQARAVQAQKVRSWIDEPNEPTSKEYDLTGLKDALAATDISDPAAATSNKVVPTNSSAGAPPNLLDLDFGAPPTAPPTTSASSYAPTMNNEWAALEAKSPPPVAAAIHSIDMAWAGPPWPASRLRIRRHAAAEHPAEHAAAEHAAAEHAPAEHAPAEHASAEHASAGMPPPNMPPNMPPPNMPPPNMPPPNMPPPNCRRQRRPPASRLSSDGLHATTGWPSARHVWHAAPCGPTRDASDFLPPPPGPPRCEVANCGGLTPGPPRCEVANCGGLRRALPDVR